MKYYPKEINIAFNKYREVKLPMNTISSPTFEITNNWDFNSLIIYINSFSAMQTYRKVHGKSGLYLFEDELLKAWGGNRLSTKQIKWQLYTNFSRK